MWASEHTTCGTRSVQKCQVEHESLYDVRCRVHFIVVLEQDTDQSIKA
jgi:hypothetical protein